MPERVLILANLVIGIKLLIRMLAVHYLDNALLGVHKLDKL